MNYFDLVAGILNIKFIVVVIIIFGIVFVAGFNFIRSLSK